MTTAVEPIVKAAADRRDIIIDWSSDLHNGDEITECFWRGDGLRLDCQRISLSTTAVRASGGTTGYLYKVICHAFTATGLTLHRKILVRVTD